MDVQEFLPAIYAGVIIIGLVMHEIGHGVAALIFGDTTAKDAGRLTLNPIPHIDLKGTIFVPGLLMILKSPMIIGWAKPIPINFAILKKHEKLIVAGAGIITNLILSEIGLIFYYSTKHLLTENAGIFLQLFCIIGFLMFPLNLFLALFNLIPIPPLDGWVIYDIIFQNRKTRYTKKFKWQYLVMGFVFTAFIIIVLRPAIGHYIKLAIGH